MNRIRKIIRFRELSQFVLPTLFWCASILGCASAGQCALRYEVSLAHPEQHLFHVRITVPGVQGSVTVQMAAWNAIYQIRDFSSRAQNVQAFAAGQKLPIEKIDKQTWRVLGSGEITVDYATSWDEVGPFASQLNPQHAFINPAMILMYVPERRAEPVQLTLKDLPAGWNVESAALPGIARPPETGEVTLSSPSFDVLADSPIEAGTFEEFRLKGDLANIYVIVHGDGWNKNEIEHRLQEICAYEIKLMGEAPFDRYLFIVHTGNEAGGGGMEHANSTAIGAPTDDYLPNTAAHEFFHLWNVKRIRPASLEPVDFTKEQYTRALWFAEGFTSTYGAYTLVRSGLWSKQRFYDDLSAQITELESRPANRWQSVEQSSLDAWLEKYPLYTAPDYSISYYTKGQVLGELLDILIRDHTENRKSLDDVMRELNERFAKQKKTYRDSLDVRLAMEHVAGTSFQEFFDKYVSGAEALPYAQILALAGLQLRAEQRSRAVAGFTYRNDPQGLAWIAELDPASAAAKAGLREGDLVLEWNGGKVPRRLDRWLRDQRPGGLLKLRILRREKDLDLQFPLDETKEMGFQVAEESHAPGKAKEIREGLLQGRTSTSPLNTK